MKRLSLAGNLVVEQPPPLSINTSASHGFVQPMYVYWFLSY